MGGHIPTFDTFPEVVAVSPDRGKLAQVVVGAPDVNVLVLRATDDVGEVVAAGRKKRDEGKALTGDTIPNNGQARLL